MEYSKGTAVAIGDYNLRCTEVLGRGSFGEVWAGEVVGGQQDQEVALKDIVCRTDAEYKQALFEVNLLKALQQPMPGTSGQVTPMYVPRYLAHREDKRQRGGWRLRIAMTRMPGEPVDAFLAKAQPKGQDGPAAVRRGCALATQLIRQLGPTLERTSLLAWHRDVNSHNVMLSNLVTGKALDPEEPPENAQFWLIDFGLAVESHSWPSTWPTSDIGGDCRYWPPSSWLMSFYGADSMAQRKDLCHQYETRLDIFALGVMALELLCVTALATDDGASEVDGLRGSWRRLLTAWSKYRHDVTRWHTQIYEIFAVRGDIGPLYQELARENVVDKVLGRVTDVRACLRACVDRATDSSIQALLRVVDEMLSESSSFGLAEAVLALSSGEAAAAAAGPAAAQQQHAHVTTPPASHRQAPLSPPAPTLCSARQHLCWHAAMPRIHSPTPPLARAHHQTAPPLASSSHSPTPPSASSGPGYLSHRPMLAQQSGRRAEAVQQDGSVPGKRTAHTSRPMCGGA